MKNNITIKSEKGITGIDLSIAILILVILVPVVLTIFYNIYLNTSYTSRQSTATNYAIQILEYAQALPYDDVTEENLQTYITDRLNVSERQYNCVVTIPLNDKNDVVKTVSVTITYRVGKSDEEVSMERVIADSNANFKWNPPKLADGMTPVKWDEDRKVWVVVEDPENDTTWHDYDNQKWGNVMTEDGSMWVWIPRYGYKITYYDTEENKNLAYSVNVNNGVRGYSNKNGIVGSDGVTPSVPTAYGKIDIVYLKGTSSTFPKGYEDYIVHPAFTDDVYKGGWDSNTEGFWVAKFEMSMETSSDSGTTWTTFIPTSSTSGNIGTTNAGNTIHVRAVSKPNVSSWRYINIANCYENSFWYDRDKESHLIKNSEWGAVAYLTHSKYGRNGTEIRINNNMGYYTGWGATTHNASSVSYNVTSADNLWTGQYGLLASTTGNITGIYDLSGGAWEYIAVFNKAYSGTHFTGSVLSASGTHFAENGKNSTKYETAYYHNANSTINTFVDYFTNGKDVSRIGEGSLEVFVQNAKAWNGDYTDIVNLDYPFLARGGDYDYEEEAGVFHSCGYNGNYCNNSFRVVCVF